MLVGGKDNGRAFFDQGVEGMEELVLRGPGPGQEVDIIDGQRPGAAIAGTERRQCAGPHRVEEAIGERLGRDEQDIQARVIQPQAVNDRLQEVGLAQSDTAMNHQRVEHRAGRMSHLTRRGVGQTVARTGHKVVEPSNQAGRRSRGLTPRQAFIPSAVAGGRIGSRWKNPVGTCRQRGRGRQGRLGIARQRDRDGGARLPVEAVAIGLDDVAQGRLSLVLDRESQPYRPARHRLPRFGQAVSEMVLDPFPEESARHLNFQGAAITAEPQPHPLAKPEPKPRFTQPLGDRWRRANSTAPGFAAPCGPRWCGCSCWACPGCTAMTPSPAPSSLWAYTRVVAGHSFLTAGAKHPGKPIAPKIPGNPVPWPCAGLQLPGAASQPRTYALCAGCCQKGKMGKTHGKQSDRRYLADLTIEGGGVIQKGIPSMSRGAAPGSVKGPRSRSRQLLDRDIREAGQLIVVGQEHIRAGLERGGEMQGIGQPVPPRLSGRDRRVGVAAPDRGGSIMHRGRQAQRPQVRPVEEPEEVRQPRAAARAQDRDQTFRTGQFADRESMAGLFESRPGGSTPVAG